MAHIRWHSDARSVYINPMTLVVAFSYPSHSEPLGFSASTRLSNAIEGGAMPLRKHEILLSDTGTSISWNSELVGRHV